MSTRLTVVGPGASFQELKMLFERRGIHHIPVEDEIGHILGIVSTEDLHRVSKFAPSLQDITAQNMMTPDPVCIEDDVPIGKALSILLDNRFRALPVVDKEKILVGIITPYDFLEMAIYEEDVEKN